MRVRTSALVCLGPLAATSAYDIVLLSWELRACADNRLLTDPAVRQLTPNTVLMGLINGFRLALPEGTRGVVVEQTRLRGRAEQSWHFTCLLAYAARASLDVALVAGAGQSFFTH